MDKQHIKGQSAIEFMALAAVVLFIFIVMLSVISTDLSYINKKKEIIIGEDIVTKVQREVNLAARVVDGYSREFKLPEKLDHKDYNIFIVGNEVILRTEKQDFWRVIPPVTGNITNGKNTINKTNGIIYLNQE